MHKGFTFGGITDFVFVAHVFWWYFIGFAVKFKRREIYFHACKYEGQKSLLDVFSYCSPPHFFETRSLTHCGAHYSARLADCWDMLSPTPVLGLYTEGFELRLLCTHSKHCIYWALSSLSLKSVNFYFPGFDLFWVVNVRPGPCVLLYVDTEFSQHCFPGVVLSLLSLVRARWHCLRSWGSQPGILSPFTPHPNTYQ